MKTAVKKIFIRYSCALLATVLLGSSFLVHAEKAEKKEVAMSYTAKAAYLIEQKTGKVLFSQNETQKLAPASLTKLMDLILIYEALEKGSLSMQQKLSCSEYAKTMGGSEIWLKEGEQMTVEELLKALIVASANDAAVVFAEAIAQTEEGFVQLMNEKAREMGLENTHFVNCTGFDEEGHYTCAKDVAQMARLLMENYGEEITKFSTIWMDSLRNGETELVNTNRLVRFYEGTTGLKTGTTDAAGHCLCATATRGDLSLISVIMGCSSGAVRFEESKQLLDYGFTHFTRFQPENVENTLEPVPIERGIPSNVTAKIKTMPQAVVRKEEKENLNVQIQINPDLQAPVQKGEEIGKVLLMNQNQVIAEEPITSAQEVERLTFTKSFSVLFRESVSMK